MHQRRGALGRGLDQLGVNPLAEANAGFARQLQSLHGAANAQEIKVGRFEQDPSGRSGYFRLQAPHDAGKRYRPGLVCYQQGLGRQLPDLFVERGQLFSRTREAHHDRGRLAATAAQQAIVVEGVQRLAPFEHHKVRDVDDIVDGPHAGVDEPALQPARRSLHADPRQQHGGIARGQARVLDRHCGLAGNALGREFQFRGRQAHRLARQGRHLAGHANDRQAPCQVGSHLQLQHDVAHEIDQRLADRSIVLEQDDPLVLVVDA